MFEKLKSIGPAAMIAAAFIGPGTVTTATLAGAQYGYTLLWAITFSILATFILQEMSARLGIIGQMGLGEAIRNKVNKSIIRIPALILVISAILIGNTAYEAGNISGAVLGFNTYFNDSSIGFNPLILIIGALAFFLLLTANYKKIERALVFMVSIMGIVFLCSAIAIRPNWTEILKGLFQPTIPEGALIMVIGLIGTTVVPYNLFLHSSMVKNRWSGQQGLSFSRWDTLLSVLLGGLITMAILITSSVAFAGQNAVINNASDLSKQLTPILGEGASIFLAIGFLIAGLSSAITAPLAAAFATSEILNWEGQMSHKKFKTIWIFVLGIGILFSSLGFKPTKVILFAQVANGLLLPIVAIFLLWIMNDKSIMGKFHNSLAVNIAGIIIIIITILLGAKSIFSAIGLI